MRASIRTLTAAACLVGLLGAGCAPKLSPQDAAALTQLAQIAGPTSGVEASHIERTECWLPSEHLLGEEGPTPSTWKVLCRVYWQDSEGTARHQDTTCIGDFQEEPMLEHCYRWTHYDLMPVFEDYPGTGAAQPPRKPLDRP